MLVRLTLGTTKNAFLLGHQLAPLIPLEIIMKKTTFTALALTSSVAFAAASFGALSSNPFSAKSLSSGYQVAQATTTTTATEKAKEHSCGADKKADGSCGATKKAEGMSGADKKADGSCGAEKEKMKDGKCGEGKCGADKKKADGKCGSAV